MRWERAMVIMLAAVLLIGGQTPAHAAPAVFTAINPPDSATLTASPPQVVLTFSAPIDPVMTGGYVHDLSGTIVSTGVRVSPDDRAQVVIALAPNLPSGWYMVMWNTAPDGSDDLLSGMTQFNIA